MFERSRSLRSEIISGSSVEEVDVNLKDLLPGIFQGKTKKRRMKVPEAGVLHAGRSSRAHRHGQRVADGRSSAWSRRELSSSDEIDKIAGRLRQPGPGGQREGVQRDILRLSKGRP